MKFRRAALLTTMVALLVPAASRASTVAQPPVGPFDGATVTAALEVAERAWPGNRCEGGSSVRPISGKDAASMYGKSATALGFAELDGAARGECGFWLIADRFVDVPLSGLCTVMQHEIGHLLDHRHVDDPADVMHPYPTDSPACTAAFGSPAAPTPEPVLQSSADVPGAASDDVLGRDFAPRAPTPRLSEALARGRRVDMLLDNTDRARLVVTFYRAGRVIGCADRACRQQTPWDLHGRLTRRTVRFDPDSDEIPTVRAPRRWAVATLQFTRPGARASMRVAFLSAQVRVDDSSGRAGCEFVALARSC